MLYPSEALRKPSESRQAPSSALQASAGGGAAGVGEDDGQRPAHLSARALPPREDGYLLGFLCEKLGYRRLFGYLHPTPVHGAAFPEKVC
jgi:hypothetical protein